MTLTTDLRDQLRARRKPPPEPWSPPEAGEFAGDVVVLPWDATLSHCAWVVLQRIDGSVLVHDKGTINITTDLTGYMSTWEKARLLRPQIRQVLDTYPTARAMVEAPAVHGSRVESSLIAGMLIWLEGACPQISPTHVSAVLCGNARLLSADRKRAIKQAVARYVPESAGRTWNEHERDALAVGLTWLYDQSLRDRARPAPSLI